MSRGVKRGRASSSEGIFSKYRFVLSATLRNGFDCGGAQVVNVDDRYPSQLIDTFQIFSKKIFFFKKKS